MRTAAPGRNPWPVDGGDLVHQFHDAGLLDEWIVQVGPARMRGRI
jgi:dihydrofolate reductase